MQKSGSRKTAAVDYPAGKVDGERYPELCRRLEPTEFRQANQMAIDLGLRRLDVRRPHPRLVAQPTSD